MKVVPTQRAVVMTGAIALGSILLGPVLLSSSSAVAALGQVAGRGLRPAVARDGWGDAIRVPGLAALDTGDSAGVSSASCAAPGDCTVVGSYTRTGFYGGEVFVISQVRGTWGKAAELRGLAALDKRRTAGVGSVSCSSPGDCATGGNYTDKNHHSQPFVASEVRGTWRKPMNVPGMAGLHAIGGGIGPVSCASPGNCVAGGSYSVHPFREQAFLVSQTNGTWSNAVAIPGLATLNTGHNAGVASISCPSPGNCTADGTYSSGGHNSQAFVVSEVNGTWGQVAQVPGLATLATGGYASIGAMSCMSPGNCTAMGNYNDTASFQYPFVVSEVNGTWGDAQQIPGMTALNPQGAGAGYSLSCTSPGDCVAAGSEGVDNGFDVGGGGQPFVATQTNGTWGDASLVPAMLHGLNSGADGAVTALACPSAGNCVASGYYGIGKPDQKVYNIEVFVSDEIHGTWGTAIEIPGTAGLNRNHWAFVGALSCAARLRCVVGGSYTAHSDVSQPFIDSRV
jgi:hypothetical protein